MQEYNPAKGGATATENQGPRGSTNYVPPTKKEKVTADSEAPLGF